MSNARQIPRLSLSDQIAEVMLVREAYQKRATDLYHKGHKQELAAKLSATSLTLTCTKKLPRPQHPFNVRLHLHSHSQPPLGGMIYQQSTPTVALNDTI